MNRHDDVATNTSLLRFLTRADQRLFNRAQRVPHEERWHSIETYTRQLRRGERCRPLSATGYR